MFHSPPCSVVEESPHWKFGTIYAGSERRQCPGHSEQWAGTGPSLKCGLPADRLVRFYVSLPVTKRRTGLMVTLKWIAEWKRVLPLMHTKARLWKRPGRDQEISLMNQNKTHCRRQSEPSILYFGKQIMDSM